MLVGANLGLNESRDLERTSVRNTPPREKVPQELEHAFGACYGLGTSGERFRM